jgi:hypothetical protein
MSYGPSNTDGGPTTFGYDVAAQLAFQVGISSRLAVMRRAEQQELRTTGGGHVPHPRRAATTAGNRPRIRFVGDHADDVVSHANDHWARCYTFIASSDGRVRARRR